MKHLLTRFVAFDTTKRAGSGLLKEPRKPWDYTFRRGLLSDDLDECLAQLRNFERQRRRGQRWGVVVGIAALFTMFGPFLFLMSFEQIEVMFIAMMGLGLVAAYHCDVFTSRDWATEAVQFRLLPYHIWVLQQLREGKQELAEAMAAFDTSIGQGVQTPGLTRAFEP